MCYAYVGFMACSTNHVPRNYEYIYHLDFTTVVRELLRSRSVVQVKYSSLSISELRFHGPFLSRFFMLKFELVAKLIAQAVKGLQLPYALLDHLPNSDWFILCCPEIEKPILASVIDIIAFIFITVNPGSSVLLDSSFTPSYWFTSFAFQALCDPLKFKTEASAMLRIARLRESNELQLTNDEEQKIFLPYALTEEKNCWICFLVRQRSVLGVGFPIVDMQPTVPTSSQGHHTPTGSSSTSNSPCIIIQPPLLDSDSTRF